MLTSWTVEFDRAPGLFLYFLFVETSLMTSTTTPPVADGADSAGALGLGTAQGPRLTGVLSRQGAIRGGLCRWASGDKSAHGLNFKKHNL